MKQEYMIIDGQKYTQGTIFVVKDCGVAGITEKRMTFLFYDTERKHYWFISPTNASAEAVTIYPDTRFMNSLIKVDRATEKEARILRSKLHTLNTTKYISNCDTKDTDGCIIRLAALILIALCPPLAIVLIIVAFTYNKK